MTIFIISLSYEKLRQMKKTLLVLLIVLAATFKCIAQSWTHYDTTNSGLTDNWVTGVAIDASGNKWFGTERHGILKFDGTNWTSYYPFGTSVVAAYIKIIVAEGNVIWVGGLIGLAKYDGNSWTVYHTTNSGLPDDEINAIAIDKFGNKWLGSTSGMFGGGLTKFDGINWFSYNQLNSGITITIVGSIGIDSISNDVWLGSNPIDFTALHRGLIKFDGSNWTVFDSTNSGIYDYNYITSIAVDATHNIWVGTWHQGLVNYNGSTWSTYDTSNTLELNGQGNSFGVFIDPANTKWIYGTGKIISYNDTVWTIYDSTNSPLPRNFGLTDLAVISFENNARIWIPVPPYGVYDYNLTTGIIPVFSYLATLNVFPNPFYASTNIEKTFPENINFILYDSFGNEVRRIKITTNLQTFPRNDLSSGVYYYSAFIDNRRIAQGKIIIQ